MKNKKIAALIVTFNRLDKLKTCLLSYESQTFLPSCIIVVNNGSTDGTKEFLDLWSKNPSKTTKYVINLSENEGGSGGYYEGMKKSLELDFDYLCLGDDDAYPQNDAFEKVNFYSQNQDVPVLCSTVVTKSGVDLNHRRIIKKGLFIKEKKVNYKQYSKESFQIDLLSFVGAFFEKSVIEKCGLPNKDFFIWHDDTEYSLRVGKSFPIFCFPKIVFFHDTNAANCNSLSWKCYYGERNLLYVYKKYFGFVKFKLWLFRFELRKIKYFLTNKKYYYLLKDAFTDYKQNKLGVSPKYKPEDLV